MFEVSVKGEFSAAHFIEGHGGECARLHGHNWSVELCIISKDTDRLGMSIDFGYLKNILRKILSQLDHTLLNDNPIMQGKNPTAENIAMVIYNLAKLDMPDNASLLSVTVMESANSMVRYRVDE